MRYDSSVAWVNDEDESFLARVMRFISVSSCCHAECHPVTLAEITHFDAKRDAEGRVIARIHERARIGYVGAETLKPQVGHADTCGIRHTNHTRRSASRC